MAECWNGIQIGLKIRCPLGIEGSSPSSATKLEGFRGLKWGFGERFKGDISFCLVVWVTFSIRG